MSCKPKHKRIRRRRNTLRYTALGDSIAFGIGASSNYGYVNYFRDFLATKFHNVILTNRAVPGFTSTHLLQQLQQDPIARQAVKKANIITISIGGANLFNCMATPTEACFGNGVLTFAKDWPRILREIRKSIGSKAKLFVMTVYNPLQCNDPNYNFVDFFIQKINRVIKKCLFRSRFNYKVVDVHRDFQGTFTDGRCKVCTWTHFCEIPPDVHPTDAGHLEIARLHELKFLAH